MVLVVTYDTGCAAGVAAGAAEGSRRYFCKTFSRRPMFPFCAERSIPKVSSERATACLPSPGAAVSSAWS